LDKRLQVDSQCFIQGSHLLGGSHSTIDPPTRLFAVMCYAQELPHCESRYHKYQGITEVMSFCHWVWAHSTESWESGSAWSLWEMLSQESLLNRKHPQQCGPAWQASPAHSRGIPGERNDCHCQLLGLDPRSLRLARDSDNTPASKMKKRHDN
jgi:hypothetical protein